MKTASQLNVGIQLRVVLVGIVLLAMKFFAYYLTNSTTILTDALESIINVVAGGLGLYSLIIASLPKDENHPYGHGKVEFISAGVEGTLIALAGLLIIIKSGYSLFYPPELSRLDLGIYITGFAGLLNYLMGYYLVKRGKESHSITLEASGEHLKSDAYSTVGLVLGLGLILATGFVWLDSVVALGFGALIGFTGFRLVKASVAGIMDEVDYALVEKVVEVLQQERRENWVDIHNLRIIKYGATLHIDCHLTLPWFFNTREAHAEVDALEDMLKERIEGANEFFVHVDSCIESSCKLCCKKDCPLRQAEFEAQELWTIENIMLNKKHGKKNSD